MASETTQCSKCGNQQNTSYASETQAFSEDKACSECGRKL